MKTIKAMQATKKDFEYYASARWRHKLTKFLVDNIVAQRTGIKSRDVKVIITKYMEVAASELKKNGAFRIDNYLKLTLKKKPSRPAQKGVNPFTQEPCVFKAKPASNSIRALALKKFQDMLEIICDQ